jgi:hypothetical protein
MNEGVSWPEVGPGWKMVAAEGSHVADVDEETGG